MIDLEVIRFFGYILVLFYDWLGCRVCGYLCKKSPKVYFPAFLFLAALQLIIVLQMVWS